MIAAALAALFLAGHLAFLPVSLEDLDSINFALGLSRFDVAQHQPHPPGYPVYIVAARAVRAALHDDVRALALLSAAAGAMGVTALIALFGRIDRRMPRRWAVVAAAVTATSPLYWFTAARPLSDAAGLAAAVAVQAVTMGASTPRALVLPSFIAGLAIGIRSQVALLTVPLLMFAVARQAKAARLAGALRALWGAETVAFVLGVALWAVPLVALTGGPAGYWHAVAGQGAEDLSGIQMLWTTPTPRQIVAALYYGFVAPWAVWPLATGVLLVAVAGLAWTARHAQPALCLIAVAFGPYLVFDLLFQETFTTRYALPLVPPVVYLAVRAAAALPRSTGVWFATVGAGTGAIVGSVSVAGYASLPAPAFRLIADMRAAAALVSGPPRRVLAMHRREDLDLRRPIRWTGADMPAFTRRLAAPPKREWLEAVKYWNGGGEAPVWFVADPLRTDLALIDRAAVRRTQYRWPLAYPVLLGGVRPSEMDWYMFDAPGWYLGQGWALTPETAGVSDQDHRGPGIAPVDGWIRRRSEPLALMIGGRNLVAGSPPSRVTVRLDGREVGDIAAPPGFFLKFFTVAAGDLQGIGRYARISVAADRPRVALEQFDAQSLGRVVFGFGDGWHEMEANPATGRLWRWMSERGVLGVRAKGRRLRFSMAGQTERFSRDSQVTLRIQDRAVAHWTVGRQFRVDADLAPDLLADEETAITIEADQFFVPAERSWRPSNDRRHLALRVDEVQLKPAS